MAHGEGKFILDDKNLLSRLKKNKQIVFQYSNKSGKLNGYPDNPNGALENIAGICDQTGRILGLMPHPERNISLEQHPKWDKDEAGIGLRIFKNGVDYIKKHL